MAKTISFTLGDATLNLALAGKVDKAALYGKAKRIAEKDGKELQRGVLLADGTLLPRSAISYPRADDLGTPIEPPVAHVHGSVVEKMESSFNRIAKLEPVPLASLALFAVRDVYPLESEQLPPVGLYQTDFNYMPSYQLHEARVLVRADGLAFLLVGTAKASEPVQLMVNYAFFDTDEEAEPESEELDFSMI